MITTQVCPTHRVFFHITDCMSTHLSVCLAVWFQLSGHWAEFCYHSNSLKIPCIILKFSGIYVTFFHVCFTEHTVLNGFIPYLAQMITSMKGCAMTLTLTYIFKVIQLWLCNKTAKIWHIFSCPSKIKKDMMCQSKTSKWTCQARINVAKTTLLD